MVELFERGFDTNLKIKFNLYSSGREVDYNTSSIEVIRRLSIKSKNIERADLRTRTNIQSHKMSSIFMKEMVKKFSSRGDTLFNDSRSNSQDSIDNFKINDSSSLDKSESFLMKVTREMESSYHSVMKECFIDHIHNVPESYDEYVIKNLRVIKCLQFFFNQVEYDNAYNQKRIQIAKNFKFDFNLPYVLLDLDETLIHSEVFQEYNRQLYDKIVNIDYIEDGELKVEILGVFIRPFAREFLEWASEIFKLVLFTAAEMKYAFLMLKAFEIEKYFEVILDKEYTIDVKGFLIKDVTLLNNSERLNCVIIDNNIFSFASTLAQGILISSFYNEKDDFEFRDLKVYFEETIIPNIENMVNINSDYFMYQELMFSIGLELDESFNNN